MTEGYDMINVLGGHVGPPNGNSSNLYNFYWPRGGTNNPNTSVIEIRAVKSIIDILENDFYTPCN